MENRNSIDCVAPLEVFLTKQIKLQLYLKAVKTQLYPNPKH